MQMVTRENAKKLKAVLKKVARSKEKMHTIGARIQKAEEQWQEASREFDDAMEELLTGVASSEVG